jgi:AAA15 family ATPase/GTPase
LDSRLHPLLTQAIIRLFNSPETNPKNAQLVFTTHDTNLLCHSKLRRDQIWFTEKTEQGSSDLYSLAEIKLSKGTKVRKDASYQKDYFQGRYGAIPFLGDLAQLFHEENGNGCL